MTEAQIPNRRAGALSKDRIVDAAVAILDADGEGGLTFRALSSRLKTGSGAIYWHVADKSELVLAATDRLIADALRTVADTTPPEAAIRAIALAVFDALDAHPWIGTRLTDPSNPASLQIFERIGAQLLALSVPERSRFDIWSALISYILGVAGQNAANARVARDGIADRATLLRAVADQWARLDPVRYPFLRQTASQLADHDDRAQYLAGLDLILAGIERA